MLNAVRGGWRDVILDRPAPPAGPFTIGMLAGEGIGPEVTAVARAVLDAVAALSPARIVVRDAPEHDVEAAGGGLAPELVAFCREVFGAGGALLTGPAGGRFVYDLRRAFDLFCKIVPVKPAPELVDAGRLRAEHVADVDLVIVRENVSGAYYGTAQETAGGAGGRHVAWTFSYDEREVRRIVRVGARLAARRRGRLAVVGKEGGMPALSRLWRDVAVAEAAAAGVQVEFVNVDLAAYRLVQHADAFDVLVAPNLLGDVLADLSAVLLGSRGLGASGNFAASGASVYQTNHGAAHDLAGTDAANPAAHVQALAMLLRESFGLTAEAALIEDALARTWQSGVRTRDLARAGEPAAGTREFGDRVVAAIAPLDQAARRCARVGPAVPRLPAVCPGAAAGERELAVHLAPRGGGAARFVVQCAGAPQVANAARAARTPLRDWQATSVAARIEVLLGLAARLEGTRAAVVERIARDVGKPVRDGDAEVTRAVLLIQAAVAACAAEPAPVRGDDGAVTRRAPLGLVGMVTPWNNPLAIPVGKLAPALLHGNAVLWKPAPAATAVALETLALLEAGGAPPGLVTLVAGDGATARAVFAEPAVDACTLSGSMAAGRVAAAVCGRRRVPLQAELGGNNGAIVWADADLVAAARQIAAAAFGCAGQRCTATRRAIVDARCLDAFLDALRGATAALVWGDPLDAATAVGPVVSHLKRDEVAAAVARAARRHHVWQVHERPAAPAPDDGAWLAPAIVCCDDPSDAIVQEETFGPVLVVQPARDFDHALALLDGVRHGLAAALFTADRARRERFLREARAGLLRLDRATAGAGVDAPFGGWKESGIGPPEHGPGDREFYTRAQVVDEAC